MGPRAVDFRSRIDSSRVLRADPYMLTSFYLPPGRAMTLPLLWPVVNALYAISQILRKCAEEAQLRCIPLSLPGVPREKRRGVTKRMCSCIGKREEISEHLSSNEVPYQIPPGRKDSNSKRTSFFRSSSTVSWQFVPVPPCRFFFL